MQGAGPGGVEAVEGGEGGRGGPEPPGEGAERVAAVHDGRAALADGLPRRRHHPPLGPPPPPRRLRLQAPEARRRHQQHRPRREQARLREGEGSVVGVRDATRRMECRTPPRGAFGGGLTSARRLRLEMAATEEPYWREMLHSVSPRRTSWSVAAVASASSVRRTPRPAPRRRPDAGEALPARRLTAWAARTAWVRSSSSSPRGPRGGPRRNGHTIPGVASRCPNPTVTP